MKVNFNEALKDLSGKEVVENGVTINMQIPCINALMQDDAQADGTKKLQRYKLAKKIQDSAEATEITVEDASMIKELVAKIYGPLVVGNVYELLEG